MLHLSHFTVILALTKKRQNTRKRITQNHRSKDFILCKNLRQRSYRVIWYVLWFFLLLTITKKVIKMKKLLLVLSITIFTLFSVVSAPQAQANGIAQNLCEYVAADDKKHLRSFLKLNKLKIRKVFDSVQCNGKNLLEFAAINGSIETGSLIISKLPKKIVAMNLALIQDDSKLLYDTANSRVSS